ncbi:hypothetical protein ACJZ2D_016080 [Fusarium nematophilum]
MKVCLRDYTRASCCSDPPPSPFGNQCEWVRSAGLLDSDGPSNFCEGACHKGQVRVALESSSRAAALGYKGCEGELPFCCDREAVLGERKRRHPRPEAVSEPELIFDEPLLLQQDVYGSV